MQSTLVLNQSWPSRICRYHWHSSVPHPSSELPLVLKHCRVCIIVHYTRSTSTFHSCVVSKRNIDNLDARSSINDVNDRFKRTESGVASMMGIPFPFQYNIGHSTTINFGGGLKGSHDMISYADKYISSQVQLFSLKEPTSQRLHETTYHRMRIMRSMGVIGRPFLQRNRNEYPARSDYKH